MAKVLRCRDTGADCDFEVRADSEEEILQKAAQHAKEVHQMEVTPELADAVRKMIRDE